MAELSRLFRYVSDEDMPATASEMLCVYYPDNNLVIINKRLFDNCDYNTQREIWRTQRSMPAYFAEAA